MVFNVSRTKVLLTGADTVFFIGLNIEMIVEILSKYRQLKFQV